MTFSSFRPSRHLALLTFLATFVVTLCGTREARARSMGIASVEFTPTLGDGCHNCHKTNPGTAPMVALSASATSLTAGQQIVLTFVVTSQNPTVQIAAGFNIRANPAGLMTTPAGTFAVGGAASVGTRTISSNAEATHSMPKNNDGANTATFTTLWTPNAGISGTVTFTAWGNSVNLSGNNTGDRAAMTTLSVTVTPACTPTTWYRDMDGDTYGNLGVPTSSCTQPAGYVSNNTDCNDGSAAIHPGATEVCNGVDDNCDNAIDEGVKSTYYLDADGDGYGSATATTACSPPAQYVAVSGDCNDGSPAIHPGATEVCNGVDDNCNNAVDEGLATSNFYYDSDGDGYGSGAAKAACNAAQAGAKYVANNTDCDDTNANISPAAPEVCANGKDDNCNGTVDTDAPANSTFYKDNDGDGFGSAASGTTTACAPPAGYVSSNTDCNDALAAIHPGATEVCNGMDDNCSGTADEELGSLSCGDGPCRTTVAACVGGVPQVCAPVCPDGGVDAAKEAEGTVRDAGIDSTKDGVVIAPDTGPGGSSDAVSQVPTDATVDGSAPPIVDQDASAGTGDARATPRDAKGDGGAADSASPPPGASEDNGAPTDSGCSCRLATPSENRDLATFGVGLLSLVMAYRRTRRRDREARHGRR